jgi:LytS/YehU family sensor histidine kinase
MEYSQTKHRGQYFIGIMIIGIGVLFLLRNIDVIDFPFHKLWPLIFVIIGFARLFSAETWIGAVAGLYLLSAAFFYVLISVEDSQRADQAAIESRMLAQEAELRFLRTQIDPHFLFNSLNSISALTTSNPSAAREMTILLGDFLRTSLHLGGEKEITVEQEIELVRQFLRIEQVRFDTRLRTKFEIDPLTLLCKLPPLLIQPLVENAVKHGVASLVEGGSILIAVAKIGSFISVRVENSFDASAKSFRQSGVGISNVRQRLQAFYGSQAQLLTTKTKDTFIAEVTLPLRES